MYDFADTTPLVMLTLGQLKEALQPQLNLEHSSEPQQSSTQHETKQESTTAQNHAVEPQSHATEPQSHTTEPQSHATEPLGVRNYVFGLSGIRQLFGVCHTTAQRYKNTFLAPAVRQNGRKLIIDVEMALELFNQCNQSNER
ncbi:MAG: DUF3853 family protein [Rikenellaceae bacterium]